MTMWKQRDNVKGVAHSDEFTENNYLQLPSALQWALAHCSLDVTLLFWFTLTALTAASVKALKTCHSQSI